MYFRTNQFNTLNALESMSSHSPRGKTKQNKKKTRPTVQLNSGSVPENRIILKCLL